MPLRRVVPARACTFLVDVAVSHARRLPDLPTRRLFYIHAKAFLHAAYITYIHTYIHTYISERHGRSHAPQHSSRGGARAVPVCARTWKEKRQLASPPSPCQFVLNQAVFSCACLLRWACASSPIVCPLGSGFLAASVQ